MTEQEKLIDVLDDVTASLETVLLHQGKQMTPADYQARKNLTVKAREMVRALRPDDVGDVSTLDAKEWHAEYHTHQHAKFGGRDEKVIHIVHLWDDDEDVEDVNDEGQPVTRLRTETHTDEICELVMDYSDENVRQHASILAGSIRVLKAAEALIRTAAPAYLATKMFGELADAVKVSRTPFKSEE